MGCVEKNLGGNRMDDVINRQDTIRKICGERCGCEPDECGLTMEQDGAEECSLVRWLKEVPSVQPEQWISCCEKLPDKDGRYLVTNSEWGKWNVDWNVYYTDSGWLYPSPKPIAWMPLPEPYNGDMRGEQE